MAGFLGISSGIFIALGLLGNLKSFGVPYLSNHLPFANSKSDSSYFIPPIWKRENRPSFLNTKKNKAQNKISMKWKFWKGINK